MVVEEYKQLLQGDRALLVPVIGSLSDLPLTETLKKEVVDLAKASGIPPPNGVVHPFTKQ